MYCMCTCMMLGTVFEFKTKTCEKLFKIILQRVEKKIFVYESIYVPSVTTSAKEPVQASELRRAAPPSE